jgi:hypothetical protein
MMRLVQIAIISLLLSGCVTYGYIANPLEQNLQQHRPEQALEVLEKTRHAARDKPLYLLEKAMLLRMMGDYEGSNEVLEQAKLIMRDLDAVSITEQAGAVTINDTMRSYGGETFEKELLHVYKALNFLEAGSPENARVEVLQLDVMYQEKGSETGAAIAHYVSGLVFEVLGGWSDALISYRKAYQALKRSEQHIPDGLQQDLIYFTGRQGLPDEQKGYADEFDIALKEDMIDMSSQGKLVFFLHNGLMPRKHEHAVHVQNPETGRLIRIAKPYYERRSSMVKQLRINVDGQHSYGQLIEDVADAAYKNLDKQMPMITSRAIARAAVKYRVSKEAGEKDQLAGFLVNVAGVLTERADVRGWTTLPQNIMMASLPLPPGDHDITVELLDGHGSLIATKKYKQTNVQAGDKRQISLHWPSSIVNDWRPR